MYIPLSIICLFFISEFLDIFASSCAVEIEHGSYTSSGLHGSQHRRTNVGGSECNATHHRDVPMKSTIRCKDMYQNTINALVTEKLFTTTSKMLI